MKNKKYNEDNRLKVTDKKVKRPYKKLLLFSDNRSFILIKLFYVSRYFRRCGKA